jgi:hypothetical protein
MTRAVFPKRPNVGVHSLVSYMPDYLQGTWESTGQALDTLQPCGTVAFWEETVWITCGKRYWAYVTSDGKIRGFIEYQHAPFMLAERTDIQAIVPVPMVTLPSQPQPLVGYRGLKFASYNIPDTTSPTATSSPATASRWNGTCPRCGRGTYTGAWDVEHEGGSCT